MNTTTHNALIETAQIGDILSNRYRVLQVIKSSELTQVYLTEDISLLHDNICLLKRYKYNSKQPHLFKVNKHLFELELNSLESFKDCPQIPNLLDHFEDEFSLSLIEELIQGDLVNKLLPQTINAPNCWLELNVLEFLRDTLEILVYLNSKDAIHGNLKPNHIIQRNKDRIFCIIDFANLQKISEIDHPLKKLFSFQSNFLVSHSSYFPPEQINGKVKINSNLYTLGMIGIQGLTGINFEQLESSENQSELNWLEMWKSARKNQDFYLSEDLLLILNKLVCYDYKNRYKNPQEALKDVKNLIEKKTAQVIIFKEEQWPGLSFSPSYYFSKLSEFDDDLELNFDDITGELPEYFMLEESDNLSTQNAPSTQELLDMFNEQYYENSENITKLNGLKIDQKWLTIIGGIGLTGLLIYATVIYFGLGSILNIIGLDFSGNKLLKAQAIYEGGNIQEAITIAQSIPTDSNAYQESQAIIKKWENELEKANQLLKKIELAFAQKQWETVLQDAKKMPSHGVWQDKLNPLITKAKESLDLESRQLLQQAINYAQAQEFGQALIYLKQISLESSYGELVKNKLVEYEEKRNIRDYFFLQNAFNAAQKHDFLTAINLLQKIPINSPKSVIAQQKIIEYTKMNNIKQIMEQRQKSYVPSHHFNPGSSLNEIHI